MGLTATTTNLSYARNEYIKVGISFVFDKCADMIWYALNNNDQANAFSYTGVAVSLTGLARMAIGTSATPLVLTAGTPILTLYSTHAGTSGSTSAEPILFNNVMTGAGGVGGRVRVNLATEVTLGSWANAFKASVDLGTTGGVTGLISAVCAELTMATTSISGTYATLELEMSYGATSGSLPKPCYIYAQSNGTAKTDFDDYGKFLILGTGHTAAAGHILSANAQTLKCGTGALGANLRYLILSQIEDGLGLGTSGTPQTLTYAGTKQMALYTTCASTNTGSSYEPQYIKNTLTGAGQVGGRFRVDLDTDVELGGWANAFKASLTLNDNGATAGLISAICAEVSMPTGNNAGNYACLELEMTMPSTGSGSLVIPSFIYAATSGTQVGIMDDYGFLLVLSGVNSGAGHLWYDKGSAITPGDASEWLRVKTPGGARYLMLYDSPS